MSQQPPSLDDLNEILETIKSEIAGWGRNYAPIPLAISLEGDEWRVFVDVRSTPLRTFDFEVSNPNLRAAMKAALTQLRREMR